MLFIRSTNWERIFKAVLWSGVFLAFMAIVFKMAEPMLAAEPVIFYLVMLVAIVGAISFPYVRHNWQRRARGAAVVCAIIGIGCVGTHSILESSFWLSMIKKISAENERVAAVNDAKSVVLEKRKERYANAAGGRSPAVIKAEIEAAKQNARWASSAGCTNATVEESRAFCTSYFKLQAEHAAALDADNLEGGVWGASTTIEDTKARDVAAFVHSLATAAGIDPNVLMLVLVLLFVCTMQFALSGSLFVGFAPEVRKRAATLPHEPRKADPVSDGPNEKLVAMWERYEAVQAEKLAKLTEKLDEMKATPAPRAPLPVTLGKLTGTVSKMENEYDTGTPGAPRPAIGLLKQLSDEQRKAVLSFDEPSGPLLGANPQGNPVGSEVFRGLPKNPADKPDGGGGTQAPSPEPVENGDTQDTEIAPENVEIKAENVYTFPVTKIEEVTKPSRLSRPQEFKKNSGKVTKNDRDALILVWASECGSRLPKTSAPDASAPLATDAWRESYLPWCKQHAYPIASKGHFSKVMGEELGLGNCKERGSKRSKKGRKLDFFRYSVPSELPVPVKRRASA